MTVAEALTNLAFVCISELRDVKCSGNWMWAAKLSGEMRVPRRNCTSRNSRVSGPAPEINNNFAIS